MSTENLHPIVEKLCALRGITDQESQEKFLHPSYGDLHDPMLLPDGEKAAVRIFEATEAGEKILIYADYDCDGIPGATVLEEFFKKIGYTNIEVYIPDRETEGYGLHKAVVERAILDGVTLIITIDLGTTAVDTIAHAEANGVNVIVTDHHEPHDPLPRPFAFVNPKRSDSKYPFRELCGTGVIFKLVQLLLKKYGTYWNVPLGWEKWSLDLVGLATLSDLVPLVGENRILAFYGLKVLRKTRRPGFIELFRLLGIRPENVGEDDVTFMVTPRLNAASRMSSPLYAFRLLSTTSSPEAKELVTRLSGINDERKQLVARIVKDAHKELSRRELGDVVVIGNPSWRIGVLGIVASKLVEEYKKTFFVWGREQDGNGILKGSCRAGDATIDVVHLMENVDSFNEFGGHKGAGGFSIEEEKIHSLEEQLNTVAQSLPHNTSTEEMSLLELSLHEVSSDLYGHIDRFAPFGLGNPKPVFRFSNIRCESMKQFGKTKDHLELIVSSANPKKTAKAISFFKSESDFTTSWKAGDTINLHATMEMSYFLNRPELRLRIIDIQ